MNDPIKKQAAIVAAMTQGRVKYTVAHRNALKAINEGKSSGAVSPEIMNDLKILLEILMAGLKAQGKTQ